MKKSMYSVYDAIVIKINDLEIKARALEELLKEKGTVTVEEIDEKIKLVEERDGSKLALEWINLLERSAEFYKETE